MQYDLDSIRVKDLMLPLSEYAVVSEDSTVREALLALEEAQKELPPGRPPHRAVLVADRANNIIGKAGQLTILRALESKSSVLGDLDTLATAGVTPESVSSMMDNLEFWQDCLSANSMRAGAMKIKNVMIPAKEFVDEDARLLEAIHKIVAGQTLSVLVKRRGEVIGILRVSDLFTKIADHIRTSDH